MRRLILAAVVAALAFPVAALADAPTDVGGGFTSSGASGETATDKLAVRNNNTLSTPRENRFSIRENAVNLATDPTCANQPAGFFTLIDSNETASAYSINLCAGTSTLFSFPNLGADVIANGEVLRGTGSGTGDYGKVNSTYLDLTDNYVFTGQVNTATGSFICQRNTNTNCATIGAAEGQMCWATDTDLLFVADGSAALRVDPYKTQAVSVSSNGNGTAATFNLDPSSRYIEITCNDSDGCDGTLQESSAWEPRHITIVNLSANRVRFTDVANVLTLAGSPTYLPQYGTLVLVYEGTRWVQQQAPLRILHDGVVVGGALGVDLDSRFSLTLTPGTGNLSLAPGSAFTMVGTIDKVDLPAVTVFDDEANDFGANQQTVENLDIENAAGTTIADCNIAADGSCRYSGAYSNTDDLATKGDVDRVPLQFEGSLTGPFGGATSSDGLRFARSFVGYLAAQGIIPASHQIPVATSCTIVSMVAHLTETDGDVFTVPTGNTITFLVRKNNSATGQASCTITAGNSAGSCSSLSSPSFTAPSGTTFDSYQFRASCANAGSDCTTTTPVILHVSALCA